MNISLSEPRRLGVAIYLPMSKVFSDNGSLNANLIFSNLFWVKVFILIMLITFGFFAKTHKLVSHSDASLKEDFGQWYHLDL